MTLWPHQLRMVNFAQAAQKSIIYSGCATGKTLAALTYLNSFDGLKLVLTPKAALSVWHEDHTKFNFDNDLMILNKGSSKQKAERLTSIQDRNMIVVVNYETAKLLPLEKYNWTAVVADECQKLGTHNSKQTLALTKSLAHVKNKIAMSGTLFHDGYEKLYSIVRWLNPELRRGRAHPVSPSFGTYRDFINSYCNTYQLRHGISVIKGYKNIDNLSYVIGPYTLQLKTEDYINLPDVIEQTYKVELTGAAKKAYNDLAKDAVIEMDNNLVFAPHILERIIRLQQLATSGELLDDEGNIVSFKGLDERKQALLQIIEELKEEPIVIFTKFRKDVELISSWIDEPLHYLTGSKDNHDEWKQGKGRILIVNISAGGMGVRLQRAKHAIYWSVGYSNTDFEQSKWRLRRPDNNAKTVFRHYIVTKDTIDEAIYEVLKKKNKFVDELEDKLC